MTSNNKIDYIEFSSTDVAQSKEFFTELFMWSFEDYGTEYTSFDDGRLKGGFFKAESISIASAGAPLIVLYHEDLDQIMIPFLSKNRT